jgi:hypothetical protein
MQIYVVLGLYCNVDDKSLLGNDPASEANVSKQGLCKQFSTMEPKVFSVRSVRLLYNRVVTEQNSSEQ